MIRKTVLSLIRLYQVYLSPHKGFRCAHAAVHGGPSCSAAVAHIVDRDGLWGGRRPIRQRFGACRSAAQAIQRRPPSASRGAVDCDFGLSSCFDGPSTGSCTGGAESSAASQASGCLFAPVELLAELISLRRLLQIIFIVLIIAAATKAYFYGSTIESVVVTQTTTQSDSALADGELGLVDRILSGRELRYFITLEKANGRAIESSPVPGSFDEGIVFRPDSKIRIGQVDTLLLKRKQALKSETLLNVAMHESDPIVTGYRIEVRTNWAVFQRELD